MPALGQQRTSHCGMYDLCGEQSPENGDKVRESTGTPVRPARFDIADLDTTLELRSPMPHRPSDEEVGRQILRIFVRHRVTASGTLQRNSFFDVRDGDFQRGINKAVANDWIKIDLRNRYRYQLTATGYAVGRTIDPLSHPTIDVMGP